MIKMKMLALLRIIRHLLFKVNLCKTIYINYKMFPFRYAMKLPIYVYGRIIFRDLSGEILIKGNIHSGMIKIGKNDYYVATSIPLSIWTVRGNIIFNGPINFLQGSYILVSDNASLEFGCNSTFCGSNLKVMCFDSIKIGNNVEITWDVQIMDTSFHYISILDHEPCKLTAPITIGDFVWIGNKTTIMKGAMIPNRTIVASNSLVNKDFHDIGQYCLLAGQPAKVKANGFMRIYDTERQKRMDMKFGYVRTHL